MTTSLALMHLHGTFFVKAVKDHPSDPVQSPYGPSFLAAYSSALVYVKLVRTHYEICPAIMLRNWVICRQMFSALVRPIYSSSSYANSDDIYHPCLQVILGTVVVLAPTSRLAGSALSEMNLGITFVQDYAIKSRRAHKALVSFSYTS